MPAVTLPISNGNLPEGLCPITEQERLNAYVAAMRVQFPFNYTFINTGSTAPSADNRIFPWYRSNPDGTPDKLYSFSNGEWLSLHPTPANSPLCLPYRGTLGSIDTYDGGESGSVTAIAGPMWQVDTEMSGLMALGVSDDYAYNTTGGNASILLTIPQLPEFTVDIPAGSDIDAGVLRTEAATADANDGTHGTIISNSVGGGEAVNILNPYRAIYWVRRTARVFYRL